MFKIENLNAVFLATAPALFVYVLSGGMPLYFVLLIILIFLNMIFGKVKESVSLRKNEIQWYVAILILSMVGYLINYGSQYFNNSLFVNNFIGLSLLFCGLILFTSNCNIGLFKKTVMFVGVAASAICVLQRAQLLLTGSYYQNVFLPGLEINRDFETFASNRVSAFFTEPAHLALFLLPIYYLSLKNNSRVVSALLGAGILFSGSTTGLLILILLSASYIISNKKNKIYILLTIVIFLGLYVALMYIFPDVMLDNIAKLSSAESDDGRLLGPLKNIDLLNTLQIMFGVGLNQLTDFLASHGRYVTNEWGVEVNANYANSVIYMFLCYGGFGLLFFIRYLINLFKSNKTDMGIILFVLGIVFSDQVLFNMHLLYILTFAILSTKLIIGKRTTSEKTDYPILGKS